MLLSRYPLARSLRPLSMSLRGEFHRKKQRELDLARAAGGACKQRQHTESRGDKVGRNDPYPYRSNRSSKGCHGAGHNRHLDPQDKEAAGPQACRSFLGVASTVVKNHPPLSNRYISFSMSSIATWPSSPGVFAPSVYRSSSLLGLPLKILTLRAFTFSPPFHL